MIFSTDTRERFFILFCLPQSIEGVCVYLCVSGASPLAHISFHCTLHKIYLGVGRKMVFTSMLLVSDEMADVSQAFAFSSQVHTQFYSKKFMWKKFILIPPWY